MTVQNYKTGRREVMSQQDIDFALNSGNEILRITYIGRLSSVLQYTYVLNVLW